MSEGEIFSYSESWFSELQDQVIYIRNASEWSAQNGTNTVTLVRTEEAILLVAADNSFLSTSEAVITADMTEDEPQHLNLDPTINDYDANLEPLPTAIPLIKCTNCHSFFDEIAFPLHICRENLDNNLMVPPLITTPCSRPEEVNQLTESATAFNSTNETNAPKTKKKKVKGQFQCTVCNRILSYETRFIRHMQKHLNNFIVTSDSTSSPEKRVFIKCFLCGRIFFEPNTAFSHLCSKIAANPEERFNYTPLFLKKEENGWTFHAPTEPDGTLPMLLALISSKYLIQCEFCEFEFSEVSSLIQHSGEHVAERPFECFSCGIFERTAEGISAHWETQCTHMRKNKKLPQAVVDRYLVCNVCKHKVPNLNKLLEHRYAANHFFARQNKTIDVRQIPCEYCEMVFQVEEELVSHFNEEHIEKQKRCTSKNNGGKSRNYVCEICGKTYVQSGHLQQHLRFHKGVKPHACEVPGCTRKFTIRADLNDHTRQCHTGERPFKCLECGKRFLTSSVYYQHRLIHRDDRRHQCEECGKKFQRSDALKIHRRIHSGEKPYECTFCSRRFRRRGDRSKHIQNRHAYLQKLQLEKAIAEDESNPDGLSSNNVQVVMNATVDDMIPDNSEMVFQVEEDLLSHSSEEHTRKRHTNGTSKDYSEKSRTFLCELCGKTYVQSGHLLQHLRFHKGVKPFACEVPGCTRKFTIRADLNDHTRKCHTGERPFKCLECGKRFLTSSVYYQHRLIHRGDRRHECQECGKKFQRSDALKIHRRIHSGEKPYECTFCSRRFRQRGDRSKHIQNRHAYLQNLQLEKAQAEDESNPDGLSSNTVQVVMNTTADDMIPDNCEMVFPVEEDLLSHSSKEHTRKRHTNGTCKDYSEKSRTFLCELCGKTYVHWGHLLQHLRFHKDVKPYACEVPGCTRKFNIQADLNDHTRKCHTGERPYKCVECGKRFLTSFIYYQHRLIHRGDRRYECQVCGKKFQRSDALKIHRRIHSGEKPYECTFCSRPFRRRSDWSKHIQNRHAYLQKLQLEKAPAEDESNPDGPFSNTTSGDSDSADLPENFVQFVVNASLDAKIPDIDEESSGYDAP